MKQLLSIIAIFISIVTFSQRVALVKYEGNYGYLFEDGSWFVKPIYEDAESFSDGMAQIKLNGKWGYINEKGTLVITPVYEKAHPFNSGIALVSLNGKWIYIDKNGELLDFLESDPRYQFNEGLALIRINEKMGAMNTNGEIVVEPTFKSLGIFTKGYAIYKENDLYGLIDTSGEIILEAIYKSVSIPSEEIVTVRNTDATCGVININTGKYSEVLGVTDIEPFIDGESLTYVGTQTNLLGYVNRDGNWIISPNYRKVKRFSNGIAAVSIDRRLWGFIDETGQKIIEPKFIDAKILKEDYVFVRDQTTRGWGAIDKNGNSVIAPNYKIYSMYFKFSKAKVEGFENGLARVGLDDKWSFINVKGEVLNNVWYDSAENFIELNE